MRRHQNEEPLKDIIDKLLDAYRLKDGYNTADLLESWSELLGPGVAAYTREVKLKKGKLIVRLDSAPLRQELSYGKAKLIKILNEKLGAQVIREIELC